MLVITKSDAAIDATTDTVTHVGQRVSRPPSHDNCLLCGDKNRLGMGLIFHTLIDGSVQATLSSQEHHQGYAGILHGGFVASLLDSAMCNALFAQDIEAVTADMAIKFHQEIPYDSEVTVRGWITQSTNMLFKVAAEITLHKKVVASATSRFVKRK